MTIEFIQSIHNPKVKQWAALAERKHRDREKKFIAEGVHLVKEALLSHAQIEAIVYAADRGLPDEIRPLVEQAGAPVFAVSEAVLAKCVDTVTPQAVFAVIHKSLLTADDILQHHRSLVIATDGVQDPGNLGTIIRSADAAGASAVLLGKGTVDLFNPKTLRSTMGSLFHLPIVSCDLAEVIPKAAKQQGVNVYASRLEEAVSCYDADFTDDTWFIVGNEGQGVSEPLLTLATHYVHIPMSGKAESLNVAMASTLLLFEAMRQRRKSE